MDRSLPRVDAVALVPSDVDTVLLSHLHQDHVGNLGEVADANVLVGDLTYDPDLLDAEIVPGTGATRTQVETTRRVNQLTASLPSLVIVAAHDVRARARLE